MPYIDHFNSHSEEYRQFRPDYPDALFSYLAKLCQQRDLAWDCGTGNGQAAVKLAGYFNQVVATDINQAQLEAAIPKDNVLYICSSAEKIDLPDQSVDLITVAQALHWFELDLFYHEAKRVLKPDGVLAAWAYSLGMINEAIDDVILHLYMDILGDAYWPIERRYIDKHYDSIAFPFTRMPAPVFNIEKKTSFSHLLGYLQTWSAVKEYEARQHKNPIELIAADLKAAWGDTDKSYTMCWPIHLLVGRK